MDTKLSCDEEFNKKSDIYSGRARDHLLEKGARVAGGALGGAVGAVPMLLAFSIGAGLSGIGLLGTMPIASGAAKYVDGFVYGPGNDMRRMEHRADLERLTNKDFKLTEAPRTGLGDRFAFAADYGYAAIHYGGGMEVFMGGFTNPIAVGGKIGADVAEATVTVPKKIINYAACKLG